MNPELIIKELIAKKRNLIDGMPIPMVIELRNKAILENGKYFFEMWGTQWQPEKTLARCKARLAAKF